MHQPQYVEKLEKILRFLIKEKSLTLKDLDKIWESQLNKHEAIEKNVHDLLSKLAWDFTPEQLDHLFSCFEVCSFLFLQTFNSNFFEIIFRIAGPTHLKNNARNFSI
jgi:ubiquitin carboxyl-terminal hydrolase 9/24